MDWQGSTVGLGGGHEPGVAVRNGIVLEVHTSDSNVSLWYRVGTISGSSVKFGNSIGAGGGSGGSVAFAQDNQVALVNTSYLVDYQWGAGTLDISSKTVSWGQTRVGRLRRWERDHVQRRG